MKKLRKFIALLMCISMLWGVLTACNKADTVDTAEGTDAQTEADTGEDPGNDPVDPDKETLIIYPEFDARIERDYTYSVSVTQGENTAAIPVYNHTLDSAVTDRGTETASDEYRRFSSFAFEGEGVRVDIKVNRDFKNYSIMPSAKNFKNEFKDGVISVYLDKPDYFVLRLDGKNSTNMAVLADAPETDIPQASDENTYIIDGWKDVEGGLWEITEPNTTIYIKPGAVLNSRIRITADNCKIIGRGAIVDPFGDIYKISELTDKAQENSFIEMKKADNVVVDGIHMLNARAFNIYASGEWMGTYSVGIRVRNVKILSSELSSDGICLNSFLKDAVAEDCFVYCGDNAMVYGSGTTYKNIIVGSTCNAMYPQGDMRNILIDGVYIFRADEGIINQDLQYTDVTPVENNIISNVYATDVNRTGHVLALTMKPNCTTVTHKGEGLVVENLYLPKLSSMSATCFYRNDTESGDYKVTMKNVYIGGNLVTEISASTVGATVNYGSNTFSYTADAAETTAPVALVNEVNYTFKNEVNIGKYEVFFAYPVIREGDTVLLPYDQIKLELRTSKDAETVERNGIRYVDASKLEDTGMAAAVEISDTGIVITPNPTSDNLLLPDSGVISQYTMQGPPGYIWLSTSKGSDDLDVFSTEVETDAYAPGGLFRVIDEEIQKYGVGKYRLTFQAKSDSNLGKLTAIFDCSAGDTEQTFDTSFKWQTYELEFAVTSLKLSSSLLAIRLQSYDAKFDIKDIALVKVS